jgi:hypothetical protein
VESAATSSSATRSGNRRTKVLVDFIGATSRSVAKSDECFGFRVTRSKSATHPASPRTSVRSTRGCPSEHHSGAPNFRRTRRSRAAVCIGGGCRRCRPPSGSVPFARPSACVARPVAALQETARGEKSSSDSILPSQNGAGGSADAEPSTCPLDIVTSEVPRLHTFFVGECRRRRA